MRKSLSNRAWLCILGIFLAVCLGLTAALFLRPFSGVIAVVTLQGKEVERVDLSQVEERYSRSFTGESGITNVVEIAPGKIRVREADCPDQVCVSQGWIETSRLPIVCLPNQLIISIEEDGNADIDAATGAAG